MVDDFPFCPNCFRRHIVPSLYCFIKFWEKTIAYLQWDRLPFFGYQSELLSELRTLHYFAVLKNSPLWRILKSAAHSFAIRVRGFATPTEPHFLNFFSFFSFFICGRFIFLKFLKKNSATFRWAILMVSGSNNTHKRFSAFFASRRFSCRLWLRGFRLSWIPPARNGLFIAVFGAERASLLSNELNTAIFASVYMSALPSTLP